MPPANHSLSAASSRAVAAGIIAAWLKSGDFPDRMLDTVTRDRAFITELVYGGVRQSRALRWLARQLCRRLPDDDILACLLIGLYQIFMLADVADYAAVNETVAAAKAIGGAGSAGMVNAVLRRALREKSAWRARLEEQADGIRLSHPDILLRRWLKRYGPSRARALCEWNNRRPETVIHRHASQIAREPFQDLLKTAGIAAHPHPSRPEDCLIVPAGVRIESLPGFDTGWFYVQDPSTLTAIDLLNPQPGETVLDVCAAPGGKSAALADRLGRAGRLVALEIHADRLARLRQNFTRLAWAEVRIAAADARYPASIREALASAGLPPAYDAVLLDVPCSNTGVLRRRADARWHFSADRLARLVKTQGQILDTAAGFVRPGGRLIYSTCSLEPEENEEQIRRWLERNPTFTLQESRALFPPDTGTDGAFCAWLQTKQETPA